MQRDPLILVVDDEPDVQRVIGDTLADAGFQVCLGNDYRDAEELLSTRQPALLVADVVLPGRNGGCSLARQASHLGIPTLLITGDPALIDEQSRDVPCLAKPFRLKELVRMVTDLVARV